jgi:hypothetical protein
MKIIRTASPKNRVIQYAISDPFIKNLVYQNENLIPWDQIPTAKSFKQKNQEPQCEQAINQFIMENLVPKTFNKIKDKGTHYVNSIDIPERYKQNPHNQQMESLYMLHKANPVKAREKALIEINEPKKEVFEEWWQYINEQYKEHPAFIYMLLNPIFDTSKSNTEDPATPLDANAVAGVFEKIKGGNLGVKILDQYNEEASKSDNFVSGNFQNGWVHIPSKSRSAENPQQYGTFDQNLKTLKRYGQAAGWCVGGPTWSARYLSGGDFYIYSEEGSPKVAIRTEGPTKIAEVKGRYNRFLNLLPYWETSINFINQKGLDGSGSNDYKQIKDIEDLNNSVDLQNPESLEELRGKIQEDPNVYSQLSNENKQIEGVRELAIKSWEEEVVAKPESYENVPKELKTDDMRENAIAYFNQELTSGARNAHMTAMLYRNMPKELIPFLEPIVMQRVEKCFLVQIQQNLEFSTLNTPKEILEAPAVQRAVSQLWQNELQRSPWKLGEVPSAISNNFSEDFIKSLRETIVTEVLEELAEADYEKSIGLNPDEIADQYQDVYEEELALLILQDEKDRLSEEEDDEYSAERLRELEENGADSIDVKEYFSEVH